MKNTIRRQLFIAVALGAMQSASALTYYSRQNGAWNNPTTWSNISHIGGAAASYPGTAAGDVVIISRHTVTANVTPANTIASISLLQNGTAPLAATMLNLNTAGITLTCNAFTFTDNNQDQHMDLEVGSTAVLQVNGNFNVTRTTSNARNKRMRVYVRTTGRINVTGNFTWTYNRAGGESDSEVLLDNSGRIEIDGNLTCTIGNNNGGNNQFTWQMNNTSIVNVDGTTLLSVLSTTDGDDMNLDLNGGTFTTVGASTWRIASTATGQSRFEATLDGAQYNAQGGLTLDHQDGDWIEVLLNVSSTAAACALAVTGNTTLAHADGGDVTIELNDLSTFSTTGNCGLTFTENDDDDLLLDVDGGTFSVSGTLTCTMNGGGSDHDLNIEIDGTGQMAIGTDLILDVDAGRNVEFLLNDNGGTSAVLNVGRDMVIDKENGSDDIYVELNENAAVAVGRDLIGRHSPDNDDEFWIDLNDSPSLTIGRNMDLTMDDGNDDTDDLGIDQNGGTITAEGYFSMTRSAGDDFLWDQDGGTATFGGNWTVISTNGDDIDVTLDGSSQLSVSGDMLFDIDGGDETNLWMNENNGSGTALNVGGDLVIDHEGPADEVEFLMNNGSTLLVGDDLRWDQTNTGGDYARWRLDNDVNSATIGGDLAINLLTGTHNNDDLDYDQQGGTVTIAGNATFLHAAGDDYYCHVHNSSVFDVGGDLTFNHTGGDEFKFDQSSNNSWVYVDGDVNMIDASGGSTPTEYEQDDQSNSKILGDFNITAGGGGQCVIDMNNQAYMEIAGSFVRGAAPNRFGSLTSSNGTTIEYDGTVNTQLLSQDAGDGGDGWDYEKVVIDNSYSTYPQLSTVGTTSIGNSITFTNGVVGTMTTALLVIPNGSTSNQGDANSFVDGPMFRYGSSDFTFPVGDNGSWARLRMENMNNANAGTGFTCEYLRQGAPNNSFPFYSATIDHVSFTEYWDLDRTVDPGNNATSQVRLYWESNTVSGIVTTELADLRVAHFSSTTNRWENHGGNATGGATGNVVSTVAIANFSPITFGDRFGDNPLPVELLAFDASPNGAIVDITWRTATELDNDHFEVERSTDGVSFTTITAVAGAGNSQEELQYATIDPAPAAGMNLYRLKQVDIDGSYTHSEVVAVHMGGGAHTGPVVYPNPGNGDVSMVMPFSQDTPVAVEVVDPTGRIVRTMDLRDEAGTVVMIPTASLPSGAYSVVLHHRSGQVASSRWLKVD